MYVRAQEAVTTEELRFIHAKLSKEMTIVRVNHRETDKSTELVLIRRTVLWRCVVNEMLDDLLFNNVQFYSLAEKTKTLQK